MTTLELHRELALRIWARKNYVPKERRPATWHPIALDEMRIRDATLDSEPTVRPGQRYVPLLPTAFSETNGGLRGNYQPVPPPHSPPGG